MKFLQRAFIALAFGAVIPQAAGAAWSCPEIIKRVGLRTVLKDRHDPYPGFGSRSFYVQLPKPPPEPELPVGSPKWKQRWQAVKAWHLKNIKTMATVATTIRQSATREGSRRDLDVHLIDGPIAKATERRYGRQKQLTIPAKILTGLPIPVITSLALHALFPHTVLDPQEWAQKKEELIENIGTEFNLDEWNYFLSNHPAFTDLHEAYLRADPKPEIRVMIKQVEARSVEHSLKSVALQKISGDGNALAPDDYKAMNAFLHDANANQESFKLLSSGARSALERLSFAMDLAEQDPREVAPALRILQSALRNMFTTLRDIRNGDSLDESQLINRFGLTADSLDSPPGVAIVDQALLNLLNAEVNSYWQMDIHIDPRQTEKYVAAEAIYAPVIKKLLTDEQEVHHQIQILKARAEHPYYFQSALHEYEKASLNLEWMQALGLQSKDPTNQSKKTILRELENALEAKGRLKPPTK